MSKLAPWEGEALEAYFKSLKYWEWYPERRTKLVSKERTKMYTDLAVENLQVWMKHKFAEKAKKYGPETQDDWIDRFLSGQVTDEYLILRAMEELGELWEAVREKPQEVPLEAADVANFVALLSLRYEDWDAKERSDLD